MSSINDFLFADQFTARQQPAPSLQPPVITRSNAIPSRVSNVNRRVMVDAEVNETKKVDLKYIVEERPKPKIVREFMKKNLESIKSEEESLFESE